MTAAVLTPPRASLSFRPRLNLHRFTWDSFAIRYVRTAAGARRYGVPIGSPIPVGRQVRNRSMPDGSTRIRLTPAQRAIAGRVFGSDSGPNGASHGGGVNLDVDNPAAASRVLDQAMSDPDLTAGQRRSVRALRDKIGGLGAPAQDDTAGDAPEVPATPAVRDPSPPLDNPADLTPAQVQGEIRDAYEQVPHDDIEGARLADLRPALEARGLTREQVDQALEEMASMPGVTVRAEADQKNLTEADRAAAVRFGGDDRHTILFYEPEPEGERPTSTQPDAVATVEVPQADRDAAGIFYGPETGARLVGGRLDIYDRDQAIRTATDMIDALGEYERGPEADLRRATERVRERIQQAPEEQ